MKVKYEKEYFSNVVRNSNTVKEVCVKIGISSKGNSFKTVKKYIKLYNLDISHFKTPLESLKEARLKKTALPEDVLIIDSRFSHSTTRRVIFRNNLIPYFCHICGIDKWNSLKLTLQLDHINGKNNDNRIENLRYLCPNCHSQTATWGFKKRDKTNVKKEVILYYCSCGNIKNKNSKTCKKCYNFSLRKVDRPNLIVLVNQVKDLGYTKTGKLYSVSDNTIRKWLKR